jgi:hypothetical protein
LGSQGDLPVQIGCKNSRQYLIKEKIRSRKRFSSSTGFLRG